MKKTILLLLVLLLAIGLASCGGSKEAKKDSNYKEASLSNQIDYEMSISYPKDFKESDDKFYAQGFYTSISSPKYVGEEYTIGLGTTTVASYYKTVENLISKKKNDSIAEEIEVDGKKVFVSQSYSSDLIAIVPFSKTKCGMLAFKLKAIKDESNHHKIEDAYKELFKKDEVKDVIKSIKVKEIEKKDEAVKTDVYSVKLEGNWYLHSNKGDLVELRNNDLPKDNIGIISICTVSNFDSFVESMKKSGYKTSTKKIGSNSYIVLKKSSYNNRFLLTHKKGEEMGIRIFADNNVNDKEANKVIKTIKLK